MTFRHCWQQKIFGVANREAHLTIPGDRITPVPITNSATGLNRRLHPDNRFRCDFSMSGEAVVRYAITRSKTRSRPVFHGTIGWFGRTRGHAVINQMFQLRMPVWIRQSTLQKMSYRPTAADAVKSAVVVKAFEDIRLQPDLDRFGLGVTA